MQSGHKLSTGCDVEKLEINDWQKACISFWSFSRSAFFQRKILRLVLPNFAWTSLSMNRASWSLIPGIGFRRLISEGRFVKNKSSVALFLVGKSIICCRPISSTNVKKASFNPSAFWFPEMLCFHEISGRLKSPVNQNEAYVAWLRTNSCTSVQICSAWSWYHLHPT